MAGCCENVARSHFPEPSTPVLIPKHLWGTVENLASSCSQTRDVPAGGCIYLARGEVCRSEVFITFGGPQGHVDRLTNLLNKPAAD
jgi:hypothetical protein